MSTTNVSIHIVPPHKNNIVYNCHECGTTNAINNLPDLDLLEIGTSKVDFESFNAEIKNIFMYDYSVSFNSNVSNFHTQRALCHEYMDRFETTLG